MKKISKRCFAEKFRAIYRVDDEIIAVIEGYAKDMDTFRKAMEKEHPPKPDETMTIKKVPETHQPPSPNVAPRSLIENRKVRKRISKR